MAADSRDRKLSRLPAVLPLETRSVARGDLIGSPSVGTATPPSRQMYLMAQTPLGVFLGRCRHLRPSSLASPPAHPRRTRRLVPGVLRHRQQQLQQPPSAGRKKPPPAASKPANSVLSYRPPPRGKGKTGSNAIIDTRAATDCAAADCRGSPCRRDVS